jgi:hypothetical protein
MEKKPKTALQGRRFPLSFHRYLDVSVLNVPSGMLIEDSAAAMATCDLCHHFQPFGQYQLPVGQKTVVFAVAKDLKTYAEAGCPSCVLIWNALWLFRKSWSEQDLEDAIELQVSSSLPLLVLFRPRNGLGVYLDIYIDAGKIRGSSSPRHHALLHSSPYVVKPPLSSFLKTVSSRPLDQLQAYRATRAPMTAS